MNSLKIFLNEFLLRLFLVLFGKKPKKAKIFFPYEAKFLIIDLGGTQHSLNITPFVQIVNNNFNSSITLLGSKECYDVFCNNPFIEKVILFHKDYRSCLKSLLELNKEKFDVIVVSHEIENNLNSFLTSFIRAKYKVGFISKYKNLLTHQIPRLEVNKSHIVDRILELTKPFELSYNKTDLNIFYNTSEKSKKNIENFLIKNDLMYKFNAIINVSNIPEIGFWGVDNYNNLIKYLHNYDISVIVVSSIEDIEIAEKISDKNNILFYNTELDIYAELIKNSDFIFTPDSFTIQLGAAFKIPTFCLFVQHKESEMINVPYNSDFDFALTEKNNLKNISYGKVLNSFVPYFEYVYERYQRNIIN